MTRPLVLLAFPTTWDSRQLAAAAEAWQSDYRIEPTAPSDLDCPWNLDPDGWASATAERWSGPDRPAGVLSSSDYPGAALAALLAQTLGLPGSPLAAVLATAHKLRARQILQAVLPEANPAFAAVDPRQPLLDGVTYPCFVKPIKGCFSVLAAKVSSPAELAAHAALPGVAELADGYLAIFQTLLDRHLPLDVPASHLLAEAPLEGAQVTIEGFVTAAGRVQVLGVVDSVFRPGTRSFVRFDYPSRLPAPVITRMELVATRAVEALGLRATGWNLEMTWDPGSDRLGIIEVNPRLCGQFADLYQKVDGRSSYPLALAVATGGDPEVPRRAGRYPVAASFPLRAFVPVRVLAAPEETHVAAVERRFAGTLVWTECAAGDVLSDFHHGEDGASARYAVVNVGAANPEALLERAAAVEAALGFRFEPVTLAPPPGAHGPRPVPPPDRGAPRG